MLRTLALSTAIIISSLALPSNAAELFKGKVVKITDGDTLNAQVGNSTIRVRLACIDTPESNQSFGSLATQRLNQLVPVGSTVDIYKVDTDRYGRTIGVIVGSSGNVNLQMVREGYAVVYDQYLYNCPNSRNDLLNAENQAKANGRVFWSQSNPCMPWDFRGDRC